MSGSYPSKQKYKLDLSSLHEDHEDDKNAENEVVHHSHEENILVYTESNLEKILEAIKNSEAN